MIFRIALLETLLLCSITKFVACDIITPKSVPPDIMLYKSNLNSSQIQKLKQQFKPWTEYIDSSLKYSIKKCLYFYTDGYFRKIAKCLFDCSPSCNFWRDRLKDVCPLKNLTTLGLIQYVPNIQNVTKLPPIEFVLGKLTIETKRCPVLYMVHMRSNHMDIMANFHYLFKPF